MKSISPENLNKLKNSILKYGFSFPKAVWKSGGNNYIIDGHQTTKALKELEEEGYTIPEIPYFEVKAKDKQEAKKYLLLLNSQYGKIQEEGFFEFVGDIEFFEELAKDLEYSDIVGFNIDMNELSDTFSLPEGDKSPFQQITFTLADKQAEIIKGALSNAKKNNKFKRDLFN